MARNLRTKIPKDDVLYIFDINAGATKKFADEMAGYPVRVAGSARELAEKSVRLAERSYHDLSNDENRFSLIE
jgi:hypothetical protein